MVAVASSAPSPSPAAKDDPAPSSQRVSPNDTLVTIGFNNTSQVVTDEDGVTHYVWVQDGAVVHAAADSSPGEVRPTTVAAAAGPAARKNLPALAVAGDTIFVGWSESTGATPAGVFVASSTDGGETWLAPRKLDSPGTGLSIASDGTHVVAVWHTGEERETSEIHLARWDAVAGWSPVTRVDGSDAAPVWAAADVDGANVYVTWRDNRGGGPYRVYLRRSTDGGTTWLPEQVLTLEAAGDPSVCSAGDGAVWLAYHGGGTITVRYSGDGGATFGSAQVAGNGWFARISCDDGGRMIVGWEQSNGKSAKEASEKSAAYALGANATVGRPVVVGPDAGTTASVTMRPDGTADVVWIDRTNAPAGAAPTSGELWHAVVSK